MKELENKIIAVDFDGTIVEHKYPLIGKDVPGALDVLTDIDASGSKIILWTMRSGKQLQEAVDYLINKGVNLYGINTNPGQIAWTKSPKAYAHIYIDDAALGTPLIFPNEDGNSERPYVNWEGIRQLLIEENVIS